jgi:hypothetical protein
VNEYLLVLELFFRTKEKKIERVLVEMNKAELTTFLEQLEPIEQVGSCSNDEGVDKVAGKMI